MALEAGDVERIEVGPDRHLWSFDLARSEPYDLSRPPQFEVGRGRRIVKFHIEEVGRDEYSRYGFVRFVAQYLYKNTKGVWLLGIYCPEAGPRGITTHKGYLQMVTWPTQPSVSWIVTKETTEWLYPEITLPDLP